MASHTSNATGGVDALSRLLVAYRLPIYLGGLAVIGAPLAVAAAFDVAVPASVRTAVVVASLAVMVATYVAERRVGVESSRGSDAGAGGDEREEYPLAMRAAVALSVLGLAAGVYVGLERNLASGLVFVVGAYLFAYLGYKVLGREDGTGSGRGGGSVR